MIFNGTGIIGVVDMADLKTLLTDIVFFAYLALVLPVVSYVYFAYSLTNWEALPTAAGAVILWAAAIPYPVYWYARRRIWASGAVS